MKRPAEQKRERRVTQSLLIIWALLMTLCVPGYAYAYIDPATTTYIIQIVAAIVITLSVSFSIALYRMRMILTRFWVKVSSPSKKNTKNTPAETEPIETSSSQSDLDIGSLSNVIVGSTKPPSKPYGYAIDDNESLEKTEKAYIEIKEAPAVSVNKKNAGDKNNDGKSYYNLNSVKGKLEWLFSDQRAFKIRLALAALVSASLVFIVFIFGPLELFASSRDDMLFELDDFLGALLLVAFAAFAFLTLVLVILRGRLLDIALCIVSGLALGCFIQAAFFNGFIGQLTGEAILWHEHTSDAIINLFVWLIIILIFVVARIVSRKAWQIGIFFVSSLLIVVQIVALFSISGELSSPQSHREDSHVLTQQGILEVGKQKNIIVFLLDRLDASYIEEVREKDPHFFDELEGFTEYTDHITRYSHTYPSIVYSFSGVINDYEIPAKEYFPLAYSEHLFLDDLVAEGWETKLYLDRAYDYSDTEFLIGRASNLKSLSNDSEEKSASESFLVSLRLVKRLDTLSMFRYAPTGFKSIFWMPSSEVSSPVLSDREEYNTGFQYGFMNLLDTNGLSAESEDSMFIYYHLEGPHYPFYLDSQGYLSEVGETNQVTQTEGCFRIVYKYIEQLKALGVYDNTCIIITGDHGAEPRTRVGLFFKPIGSTETRLVQLDTPVSDRNLVPTIVEQAGIESSTLASVGHTYQEVTHENTPVRRKVVHFPDENDENVLYIYDISGHAKSMKNWHLISENKSGLDYWMN